MKWFTNTIENEKGKEGKKLMFFASVSFIAGIIGANTIFKSIIMDTGIFGDYFFMQIGKTNIKMGELFGYLAEKRMLLFGSVIVLTFTRIGKQYMYLLSGWLGFCIGVLLSAAIIQQGMEGIVICFVGMIPQYICYIPIQFWMIYRSCFIHNLIFKREKQYLYPIKQELFRYFVQCFGAFIFILAGIFMESGVNLIFLQKIYKIFNNI